MRNSGEGCNGEMGKQKRNVEAELRRIERSKDRRRAYENEV